MACRYSSFLNSHPDLAIAYRYSTFLNSHPNLDIATLSILLDIINMVQVHEYAIFHELLADLLTEAGLQGPVHELADMRDDGSLIHPSLSPSQRHLRLAGAQEQLGVSRETIQ